VKKHPVVRGKLKAFFWSKYPAAKAPAYWKSNPAGVQTDEMIIVKISSSELEDLFPAAAPKTEKDTAKEAKDAEKKANQLVALLDPRRSNNVSIVLSQFKITTEALKKATEDADDTVLNSDSVEALLKYLPTQEEVEMVRGYPEPEKLAKAEKFYLDISSIQRMEKKLKGMDFKSKFGYNIDKVKEDLEALINCVDVLSTSTKLKQVNQIILAIGNYLNSGTARGQAYGFKMETLSKFHESRSTVARTNLSHFLHKFLEDHFPTLLDLPDELNVVQKAMKVDVNQTQSTINEMSKGLKELREEVDASKSEPNEYSKKMGGFASSAEATVKELEEQGVKLEGKIKGFLDLMGEDNNEFIDVLKMVDSFSREFEVRHRTIDVIMGGYFTVPWLLGLVIGSFAATSRRADFFELRTERSHVERPFDSLAESTA